MRSLSEHYARVRSLHPDEDLCVVFDIDGTILDMRHLVVHVLLAYDGRHGTDHFRGLVADDITHHEDDVDRLLASLAVPSAARRDVAMFARTHLWDREAILASSRPFEGVFGVIRWFQLQPRTHIALNTGRSHRLRDQTLASLNTIGAAYRVRFDQDMLFTADPGADVPASKVTALGQLRDRAFRVVAVVDNEPENLRAMAMNDPTGEILYLHADTIFRSRRIHPDPLVSGRLYHLREFVPERTLPGRIELVWHGVNDEANLAQFLASDVRWAEVDVRRDPVGRLVLRHDGFDESPWKRDEETPFAHDVVRRIAAAARSVKLDIKEDGATLEQSIQLADSLGLEDDRLWFNAELPVLGYRGFRALRRRFPWIRRSPRLSTSWLPCSSHPRRRLTRSWMSSPDGASLDSRYPGRRSPAGCSTRWKLRGGRSISTGSRTSKRSSKPACSSRRRSPQTSTSPSGATSVEGLAPEASYIDSLTTAESVHPRAQHPVRAKTGEAARYDTRLSTAHGNDSAPPRPSSSTSRSSCRRYRRCSSRTIDGSGSG